MKSKYYLFSFLFLLTFGIFQLTLSGQVVINEYSVSNLSTVTDNYSSYEDWIELYNTGGSSVDLGGYYLSDRPSDSTKWQIPEGVIISAGGYKIFWTSGRDEVSGGHYHTNFKLTQTKDNPEYVVLTNPEGIILEQGQLYNTQKDNSGGRTTNGSDSWSVFTNPTPGSSNNSSTPYLRYAEKPAVSDTAGFYSGSITITITSNEPNSQIHYTTNGDEPTASSPVYSGPVTISSTTIVNARTISNDTDILPSLIEFNTYFIGITHQLAVISASAAQLDNLLNGNQSLRPFGTFEYFNEEGVRTTYGYGEFNEHGQDSWVHDQRSIDYITRDECGYNYAIRENLIPLTDRDEFQRLILRAAGDDNYPGIDTSAHLRDYFIQNTAEKGGLNLDVRKGEKGLLYVNGIYWGVYGFREKVSDHDFTNYYYNQGKYDIYYLKLWGGSWAEYGGQAAWDDWNEIHNFIKYNSMSNQSNWEYVKSRYDYTSLVDYVHINSYVVCSDWINWNVGWWRGTNPEGGHQRWGYVLWDEDATFAHYINYTGVPGISPYVSPCFPEGLTNDPEEHIVVLNKLRANAEFDQYYISRYIDLYNTVFLPGNMISYLDSIESRMAPEMPGHVARWGGSVTQWENNVQKIRNFINARHSFVPQGLIDCYDLTGPYELTVNIDPAGTGQIQLNSLTLNQSAWGGLYFGGIDIKLKAIESDPNYEFDAWVLNNHTVTPSDTAKEVVLSLNMGDNIIALFKPKLIIDSLIINEINYNSADDFDPGDWVEFYNPHEYELDITNWVFKDEDDEHSFIFPANTIIEPSGYLVLCRDTVAFDSLFPDVNNFVGEMDFGLSGNGELIRVFDSTGLLIDTVHYDDNYPWPTGPDGNGPTLELKYWQYDNALPESWAASEDHGTPGETNGYIINIPKQKQDVETISFVIYPNPFETSAILQVTSKTNIEDAEIIIYNVFGKEVKRIKNINTNRIEITRDDLPKGAYICKFFNKKKNIFGTGKLMAE
ncbi:MAG: lamin tail domain-containing protein [Bacteroidales bacterium]|nr:lamin tail domain-containing protein [Bacteroidales bacterium]